MRYNLLGAFQQTQAEDTMDYPETPRHPVKDEYHGIEVEELSFDYAAQAA